MPKIAPRFAQQLSALALAGIVLSACGATIDAQPTVQPAASATIDAQPTVQPAASATIDAQWSPAPSATVEHTAAPTATPGSLSLTGVVRPGESKAIATTIIDYLKPARPDKRIVVGTYAAQDDYAAALALPFGERPQYIYLKRDAAEAWQVILATAMPSLDLLKAQQIPEALADGGAPYTIIDMLAGEMQDPRGGGIDADLYIQGIEGDYALINLAPLTDEFQGGSIYLKHDGATWARLTGGSHFDQQTLRELGIPEELWGQ